MLAVSAVPKVENWTRDKDGGESSGQNSDYKHKSEVIDDSGTKNP